MFELDLQMAAKFERGDMIVKVIDNDLRNLWKREWLEKRVARKMILKYIRSSRLVQFMQKTKISCAYWGWKDESFLNNT